MELLEHYRRVFESFHEAIYVVDKERKILYFNPAASTISGFSQGETEGFFCYDNILNHVDEEGNHLCYAGCPLTEAIRKNIVTDHMVYLHHKEGYRVKVHVRAIPILEDGVPVGAIEVFTDETEKNLMEDEIELLKHLNLIDPLTGLYHRRFLTEKMKSYLEGHGATELGVLFLDIDDFKNVNDTYGHDVGDDVLKAISKSLIYNLKQKDVVIRYGGEEILVFLLDVNQEDCINVAEHLRVLIQESNLRKDSFDEGITVSIGATMKRANETFNQVIKRADEAMYQAKKTGKNKVVMI